MVADVLLPKTCILDRDKLTLSQVYRAEKEEKKRLYYQKLQLERVIKFFVVSPTNSEWIDREFFLASAILLYNAKLTAN